LPNINENANKIFIYGAGIEVVLITTTVASTQEQMIKNTYPQALPLFSY